MEIEDIAEWFYLADEDFETSDYLSKKYKPNYNIIYYHYARCFEKYLKGYMTYHNLDFEKNHNLPKMIGACIKYNDDFELFKLDCNKIFIIHSKEGYPKAVEATESDVILIIKSIEKLKSFKPIKILIEQIIEKYGEIWKKSLFNVEKDEILKSLDCFDYDKIPNFSFNKYIKKLLNIKKENDIDDKISKYTYKKNKNDIVYLLCRKNKNNSIQFWHFLKDFNNVSAYEFIKQFDIWDAGNPGNKNNITNKRKKTW